MNNKNYRQYSLLMSKTYIRLIACCVAVSFLVVSCVSLPPSTQLSQSLWTSDENLRSERNAWVLPVVIADPKIVDRIGVENAFTESIAKYIGQRKNFILVKTLPGKIQENDVILKFKFTKLNQKRIMHPIGVPLSFLTLGIYIFVGGPLRIDKADFEGSLILEDSKGNKLAESTSKIHITHHLGIYSSPFTSFITERTELIETLVTKAIAKINK